MYVINTLNIISIPRPTAAVQRKFCIMARCPGPGARSRAQPASPGAYWSQEGTALCNSGANHARISLRIFLMYGIDLFFILFVSPPFLRISRNFFFFLFVDSIVDAEVSDGIWMRSAHWCHCCFLPICVSLAFCCWFVLFPLYLFPPSVLTAVPMQIPKHSGCQQSGLAEHLRRTWRNLTDKQHRTLNQHSPKQGWNVWIIEAVLCVCGTRLKGRKALEV